MSRIPVTLATSAALALSGIAISLPAHAAQSSLVITQRAVAPNPFYPLVRDGYRDKVRYKYQLNERAHVRVVVTNRNGNAVLRADLGWQSGPGLFAKGKHAWQWNGTNRTGARVPAGYYKIKVRGRAADGTMDSVHKRVRVATAQVSRPRSVHRRGTETASRSKAGACHFFGFSGTLSLDCWGGKYARAVYAFHIPASAHHFSWTYNGHRRCCSPGTVSWVSARTGARMYKIGITVTNWRAFDLRRVSLTYRHPVRI
jgi:hypothetical protein